MILRTLGASEIVVGDATIGANQPMVFACLLLLALAHPRRIPRAQIASQLWPSVTPPERNHRLRTLLYRARRLGAPLMCNESCIGLSHPPQVDFRDYSTLPRSITHVRMRAAALRPVLPGIATMRLAGLTDQLDDARDMIVATVSRWTAAAIALARSAGEWQLVEQLASAARDIDPSSGPAWLSLGEAQRLTGNNEGALRTLEEYLGFVGDRGDDSYREAVDLRQRIVTENAHSGDEWPLVGRDPQLRRLSRALARAQHGHGGAIIVWGPAGIGKTRLLEEAERAMLAARTRVVRIQVQAMHALHPCSLVRELVSHLLNEPGAVGCEPDAYSRLRQLADSPPASERLLEDVTELLAALTDETPLIVVMDDMHLADEEGWPVWRALFRWSTARRVLWVVTYRALHEAELHALPDQAILPRVALGALDRTAAYALLASIDHRDLLFHRVGGNPLLLRAAAAPYVTELGARAEAAIEDSVCRLTREALTILRTLATTGSAAWPELSRELALGELLRAGVVQDNDGLISAYTGWVDALLANYPMSSPPMSAAMIAF